MKSRNATFSLLVVMVFLLLFLLKRWNEPALKEAVNRHPASLIYTRHALCRMDCRHIRRTDIIQIMETGSINFNKSGKGEWPCPTFALQGRTAGGERIRIILAQCRTETKLVTCYNLDEEFECHCPGDETKK